jgi:hypothetical protein
LGSSWTGVAHAARAAPRETAVAPLSESLQTRLGLPLAHAVETEADYLRGTSAALMARRNPPPLNAVDASFESYAVEIAELCREGLTPDLPGDEVERLFALGFTLEQLRRNFKNLEQCVTDNARSTIGGDRKRGNWPTHCLVASWVASPLPPELNWLLRARRLRCSSMIGDCQSDSPSVYQTKQALSTLSYGPKCGLNFTEDMVIISNEQNARATHL